MYPSVSGLPRAGRRAQRIVPVLSRSSRPRGTTHGRSFRPSPPPSPAGSSPRVRSLISPVLFSSALDHRIQPPDTGAHPVTCGSRALRTIPPVGRNVISFPQHIPDFMESRRGFHGFCGFLLSTILQSSEPLGPPKTPANRLLMARKSPQLRRLWILWKEWILWKVGRC